MTDTKIKKDYTRDVSFAEARELMTRKSQELTSLRKKTASDAFRAADDALYAQCLSVVTGALDFADMEVDEKLKPIPGTGPEYWKGLPDKERAKLERLASTGWMRSQDVPHGVKMSHQILIGIVKARAAELSGTNIVNIQPAVFPAPSTPAKEYDVIDEES